MENAVKQHLYQVSNTIRKLKNSSNYCYIQWFTFFKKNYTSVNQKQVDFFCSYFILLVHMCPISRISEVVRYFSMCWVDVEWGLHIIVEFTLGVFWRVVLPFYLQFALGQIVRHFFAIIGHFCRISVITVFIFLEMVIWRFIL